MAQSNRRMTKTYKYSQLKTIKDGCEDKRSYGYNTNVYGVVVTYTPPKITAGTDMYCVFEIQDESIAPNLARVRMFSASESALPPNIVGKIVRLHRAKPQRFHEDLVFVLNKYGSLVYWHVNKSMTFDSCKTSGITSSNTYNFIPADFDRIKELSDWLLHHPVTDIPSDPSNNLITLSEVQEKQLFGIVCQVLCVKTIAEKHVILKVMDGTKICLPLTKSDDFEITVFEDDFPSDEFCCKHVADVHLYGESPAKINELNITEGSIILLSDLWAWQNPLTTTNIIISVTDGNVAEEIHTLELSLLPRTGNDGVTMPGADEMKNCRKRIRKIIPKSIKFPATFSQEQSDAGSYHSCKSDTEQVRDESDDDFHDASDVLVEEKMTSTPCPLPNTDGDGADEARQMTFSQFQQSTKGSARQESEIMCDPSSQQISPTQPLEAVKSKFGQPVALEDEMMWDTTQHSIPISIPPCSVILVPCDDILLQEQTNLLKQGDEQPMEVDEISQSVNEQRSIEKDTGDSSVLESPVVQSEEVSSSNKESENSSQPYQCLVDTISVVIDPTAPSNITDMSHLIALSIPATCRIISRLQSCHPHTFVGVYHCCPVSMLRLYASNDGTSLEMDTSLMAYADKWRYLKNDRMASQHDEINSENFISIPNTQGDICDMSVIFHEHDDGSKWTRVVKDNFILHKRRFEGKNFNILYMLDNSDIESMVKKGRHYDRVIRQLPLETLTANSLPPVAYQDGIFYYVSPCLSQVCDVPSLRSEALHFCQDYVTMAMGNPVMRIEFMMSLELLNECDRISALLTGEHMCNFFGGITPQMLLKDDELKEKLIEFLSHDGERCIECIVEKVFRKSLADPHKEIATYHIRDTKLIEF